MSQRLVSFLLTCSAINNYNVVSPATRREVYSIHLDVSETTCVFSSFHVRIFTALAFDINFLWELWKGRTWNLGSGVKKALLLSNHPGIGHRDCAKWRPWIQAQNQEHRFLVCICFSSVLDYYLNIHDSLTRSHSCLRCLTVIQSINVILFLGTQVSFWPCRGICAMTPNENMAFLLFSPRMGFENIIFFTFAQKA